MKPLDAAFSPFWDQRCAAASAAEILSQDTITETCIIGGGFTGLATAYHLAQQKREAVILEANQAAWGCSGRNAGSILPFPYWHAMNFIGKTVTLAQLQRLIGLLRHIADDFIPNLIRERSLACDYRRPGVMLTDLSAGSHRATLDRLNLWRQVGINVEPLSAPQLGSYIGTDAYHGGVFLPDVAYFNPLGFGRGLAQAAQNLGARLYSQTPALAIDEDANGWRIRTPHGNVQCKFLVIATAGHTGRLWPGLDQAILKLPLMMVASTPFKDQGKSVLLKGVPFFENTMLLNLQVAFEPDGVLASGAFAPFRRNIDPMIAGAPITRRFMKRFPRAERPQWQHLWYGTACARPDFLPRIFRLHERAAAAFGYTGVGVGSSMAYGHELARLIMGTPMEQLQVPAGPLRKISFHGAVQFAQNYLLPPLCRRLM